MLSEEFLFITALRLLRQAPLLVIGLVGLWFALRARPRHRHAYTWASWGFGLLTAYCIVHVGLEVAFVAMAFRIQAVPSGSRLWLDSAYPIFLASLVVLARAVFIGRDSTGVARAT